MNAFRHILYLFHAEPWKEMGFIVFMFGLVVVLSGLIVMLAASLIEAMRGWGRWW